MTALAHGQNWPLIWIVPLVLLIGCTVGVINGIGIAFLRVPPIVMTMSVNVIAQGLLLIVTRGFPPPPAPAALTYMAAGKLGPVPVMLIVWVVARRGVVARCLYTGFTLHCARAPRPTGSGRLIDEFQHLAAH